MIYSNLTILRTKSGRLKLNVLLFDRCAIKIFEIIFIDRSVHALSRMFVVAVKIGPVQHILS